MRMKTFPPSTDEAGHHAARGLDLTVRHPGGFRGLQPKLPKGQIIALGRDAAAAAAMWLTPFDASG